MIALSNDELEGLAAYYGGDNEYADHRVAKALTELLARRKVVETWRAYKDFGDHGDPDGDPSYYQEVEELKNRHTEAVSQIEELMR